MNTRLLPPLSAALAADMATTYEALTAVGQTGAEAMQAAFIQHQIAASWTPASSPPDADTTVMLALADGEVWQGYFDGINWIEVSGLQLAPGRVTYWQHTPAHPRDKS